MPVITRSQSKMWNARNAKHEKRVVGEWEECYAVVNGVDALIGNQPGLEDFQTHDAEEWGGFLVKYKTTYFQTFGGGPEGGYFVKTYEDAHGNKGACGIYEVFRTWGKPFRITKNLTRIGARLEYHAENAGEPAQVRYSYSHPLTH